MVFNCDPTTRFVNTDGALANSGLVSGTHQSEGVNIEADIDGAEKLYLVVTNAGDNFNYDHADWINPTLIDYDGNETLLTTIKYTKATTDWYDIANYGKNVDGGQLNVGGTSYSDGIGTNANAIIEYDLPKGQYKTFKSFVGYDYAMKQYTNQGVTMEFLVFTSDPTNDSTQVALDLTQLGYDENEQCEIYDLWNKETVGTYANSDFAPTIAAHGSGMYCVRSTGKTAIRGTEDTETPTVGRTSARTYDLQGRQVSESAAQRGIYIKGGKKALKR